MQPEWEQAEVMTTDGERFVASVAIQQSGWVKVENHEKVPFDEFEMPSMGEVWLGPGAVKAINPVR